MPNVILLKVSLLNVILLNIFLLNIILLNVFLLNIILSFCWMPVYRMSFCCMSFFWCYCLPKGSPVQNTLAYSSFASATKKKRFMTLTPAAATPSSSWGRRRKSRNQNESGYVKKMAGKINSNNLTSNPGTCVTFFQINYELKWGPRCNNKTVRKSVRHRNTLPPFSNVCGQWKEPTLFKFKAFMQLGFSVSRVTNKKSSWILIY